MPDVRELLRHAAERAGHEVVDDGSGVDVLLVEPAAVSARLAAQRLLRENPDARVICVSIYPRADLRDALDSHAYLLKPFTQKAVAEAIEGVLNDAG